MAQESRLVIVIDAKNAERNARNLGNELDSIEKKGDFASKSMDALSVATRQLAGYMAGLVTVSAAISKMDTYTGLQNRLKLVTNNQVELNKATEDTFRIAQKTYSAWDSVLQVYQRFSDNAKTLNLTMDDTARLTETVSKAVAISGASAAAADAALVQFGQALASGTLRGEELNSVMEQTPALAKAIAQGMGITVGELRTVAAEGKITSQEIVKALKNVQADVDALFAKTDITISQSLTLLNNEITKFVGESGKGSGAAEVLSGSIKTLAGNLDVLTSAMMVGGAYWLGTYIPAIYASGVAVAAKTKELAAQTFAQYAAIQAERAAAAQQVLSTQAVVANTQATLAAIAAEKALEVQRLKSQITEKGRAATLTRMAELKKIEAQVTRELAVAEGALATAQARSAAAGAASVGIGTRLLGLLSGPVGIGITVASLAAGYLLMRDNGDKANDMLEKQSRYAGMAADELMKLEGAQKRAAEGELTKQLSLQNAQLSKSQNEFLLLTQSITDNNKQSAEAYRIWAELKTGVIDVNQAFNRLNQLSFISSDQINQLADRKKKVDENSKAVKQTNAELNQVRASGANAKAGFNDVSQGAKGAVQDVTELNKKLKDINKSLADRKWDADFKSVLITKYGRSAEEAELLLQTYRENQKKGFAGVTVEQDKIIKGIISQESALDNLVNKDKERTKELEKQQKVLSINAKVQANAAKYNFSGIESKYNLPAGTLSAIHMIESRGNARAYNKSTGATGGFQFLEGTAKQYGVKDRYDLA
ncbi:tape measure protein, partial [Acinetobacter baumannii]